MIARSPEIIVAAELVARIRPLLADHEPEVVGAALGELTAMLIASHAPELRQIARTLLIEVIDNLVPVIVEQMIDEGRVPDDWRETKH